MLSLCLVSLWCLSHTGCVFAASALQSCWCVVQGLCSALGPGCSAAPVLGVQRALTLTLGVDVLLHLISDLEQLARSRGIKEASSLSLQSDCALQPPTPWDWQCGCSYRCADDPLGRCWAAQHPAWRCPNTRNQHMGLKRIPLCQGCLGKLESLKPASWKAPGCAAPLPITAPHTCVPVACFLTCSLSSLASGSAAGW